MPHDHDCEFGIASRLTSIESLRALIKDRSADNRAKAGDLTHFIILGRFSLDGFGQFMRCQIGVDRGDEIPWFSESLPKVITLGHLRSVFGKLSVTRFGCPFPSSDDRCPECGDGWTLENLHDVANVDRGEAHEHVYCHELSRTRRDMRHYREIADAAGLVDAVIEPTTNGYWQMRGAPPWARLRTTTGDIIVGWRKKVINIDWSDVLARKIARLGHDYPAYERRQEITASMDGNLLFPETTDTKGVTHVHAWGVAPAIERLRKVTEVLKIGDFKTKPGDPMPPAKVDAP